MDGPIVSYLSDRPIGIELEFDAGTMNFSLPTMPSSWVSKEDGSLHNGREVTFRNPIPVSDIYTAVLDLQRRLVRNRTGINKRGGYHVHVGGNDLTPEVAYRTVKLYRNFQATINCLVGNSRINNRFAAPYNDLPSFSDFVRMYSLDHPASSRASAKQTRKYSVVNCAMVRCTDPALRSIEFRQGSPSKFAVAVCGWAALVCSFVESAVVYGSSYAEAVGNADNLEGLLTYARKFEECPVYHDVTNLRNWIQWRYDKMQNIPDDWESLIQPLCEYCRHERRLVSVSRFLNLNYPQTLKVLSKAEELGCIMVQHGSGDSTSYVARYGDSQAASDVRILLDSYTRA